MKLILSLFGIWVTPVCFSGGKILLPEFGHEIPLALLNRFISGGGARNFRYTSDFKTLSARFEWQGHSFNYWTDDWGGAQIDGDASALPVLFEALARSPRTKVQDI
ncbi:hypothetical protein [Brevundimonas sp. SL130]|uniref:hypothetical protein n=1 Tax=Brevundimonas sp. SL130 TaxID=2995143 RepID=UPI00226CC665|nr:hypothetical protein [Brevundimonas sp. SL130]WAC60007.1 hypothetical protein OU998_00750 [Brevundimonas sp. SL130]